VFDPAGFGVDLLVLLVGVRYDSPVVVEDHETGSGGALVDRTDVRVICHGSVAARILLAVPPSA
jgi:hypothetical protein